MIRKVSRLSLLLCLVLVGCTAPEATRIQGTPTQITSETTIPAVTGTPSATVTSTVDSLAAPQAILMQLTQANAFRIEDDWTGLSPLAPVEAHYDLHRQGENFAGKANFSVAGYTKERTAVEDVIIPGTVTLDFFNILSRSPIEHSKYERGAGPEYEPYIGHTDDYPSISIQIELRGESVKFFTGSQGEDHIPWGLDFRGNIYIINSAQPMRALESLAPYLKKETLQKLIEIDYIGMPDTGKRDTRP